MRLALSLALLAATTLPALAAEAAHDTGPYKLSPLQIGEIFCIARIGNDMAPVEAILTASLQQAIAKADSLNGAWMTKNPGEKPPLGDGLPWQASPDYTTDCTAGPAATDGSDARVAITYRFPDDPAGNYTDVLVLKPVPNPELGDQVWRIDDVVFTDKTTMRSSMADAFKP